MDWTQNGSLLTGLGALLGAIATLITAHVQKISRDKRVQRSSSAIIDASKIYDELNYLSSRLGVARTLVHYTSNGGGIPSASKTLTDTILYELIGREGLSPIREDYQTYPVDSSYVKILREVIDEGNWGSSIDNIHSGLYKTMLEGDQVSHVILFEICRTEMRYYYGELRWSNIVYKPTDETINLTIQIVRSKIKQILMKDSS